MKRLTTLMGIALAALLITAAGYLGLRSTQGGRGVDLGSGLDDMLRAVGLRSQRVEASVTPQAPPTVPVSRGDVQQTVIAPGQLVGTQETVLGMDVGGRLAAIAVRPGDVVHVGDVLAHLDAGPLELELQEARLRLEQASAEHARQLDAARLAVETARLRLEQAGTEHPRQLAEAELALQAAESRLAQAHFQYPSLTAAEIRLQNAVEAEQNADVEYQEALERQRANWEPEEVAAGYRRALQSARDARAIAADEYEAARRSQTAASAGLKNLQIEVQRAQIALERLQAGVDPLLQLELDKARTNLNALETAGVDPLLKLALEQAQVDLEAAALVAPFDAVVVEVRAQPGATIVPGTGLIALTDPVSVEASVTVIEEDLPLVEIGQMVDLFFDALPAAVVQGQVARIVPQRVAHADRPLYDVYVALDDLPAGLVPGMTVDASIIVAQRTGVLQLPRALVRAGADGTAQVDVWADARVEKRTVQIGLRGDVYVEILAGLREGEQVVGQ
jgi:HlyD family secretion protein